MADDDDIFCTIGLGLFSSVKEAVENTFTEYFPRLRPTCCVDFEEAFGQENTGATRKHSIPLAEYFDGEKVTLRVGDIRRKR